MWRARDELKFWATNHFCIKNLVFRGGIMQKSRCCAVLRVTIRTRVIAVKYLCTVGYETYTTIVVAANRHRPGGLLHDIWKTGLVHAKIRVLGIKRFTKRSFSCKFGQLIDLPEVHLRPLVSEPRDRHGWFVLDRGNGTGKDVPLLRKFPRSRITYYPIIVAARQKKLERVNCELRGRDFSPFHEFSALYFLR
jgi:hypothetical protein